MRTTSRLASTRPPPSFMRTISRLASTRPPPSFDKTSPWSSLRVHTECRRDSDTDGDSGDSDCHYDTDTSMSSENDGPKPPAQLAEIPPTIDKASDLSSSMSSENDAFMRVAKYPALILQPDSSPISQDQLAAEVKGIYAGLVMVEAKCINTDAARAADPKAQLGPEQWEALIALHRTLLYEHHDSLMATRHPSASPALRNLATKYKMPARMWKHGIHAFLELLRQKRPDSRQPNHMLSFIYLAYQMMALLFETVPSLNDTWIECLGDLARYRMAIEEEKEAHATWGGVAARWYTMASDRHPPLGRLYYHLGILERSNLRKLCFYAKSLTCVISFPNARDSLAALCGPIVQDQDEQPSESSMRSAEARIVAFHALVFSDPTQKTISYVASSALDLILETPHKLRDFGAYLGITNTAALFEFGSPSNALYQRFTTALNTAFKRFGRSVPTSTEALPDNFFIHSLSEHVRVLATSFHHPTSRRKFDRANQIAQLQPPDLFEKQDGDGSFFEAGDSRSESPTRHAFENTSYTLETISPVAFRSFMKRRKVFTRWAKSIACTVVWKHVILGTQARAIDYAGAGTQQTDRPPADLIEDWILYGWNLCKMALPLGIVVSAIIWMLLLKCFRVRSRSRTSLPLAAVLAAIFWVLRITAADQHALSRLVLASYFLFFTNFLTRLLLVLRKPEVYFWMLFLGSIAVSVFSTTIIFAKGAEEINAMAEQAAYAAPFWITITAGILARLLE